MKYINYSILICTLLLTFSCERILMEDEPATDPVAIFDEYNKAVTEKYAMLQSKNIPWDSLYNHYRTRLVASPREDSLKIFISYMVLALRDGHSWMDFGDGTGIGYQIDQIGLDTTLVDGVLTIVPKLQPVNYDTTEQVLLSYFPQGLTAISEGLDYGITKDSIGYIRYRDYEKEVTGAMMDQILSQMKHTKGLMVDVRGNGGGDPSYASLMAGYFGDEVLDAGYETFKTGPGKNDFVNTPMKTKPTGSAHRYTKPVTILTSRWCYSATTTLIYLSEPYKNVYLVGDTTGGGSGSTFDNELANGWIYSLSTSEFVTYEGLHIDNGMAPDLFVMDTLFTDGTDAVIDSAKAFIVRQ